MKNCYIVPPTKIFKRRWLSGLGIVLGQKRSLPIFPQEYVMMLIDFVGMQDENAV